MRIFYSLLILLFICSPSYAKRLDEMNANTSPDITNDLIYSQDVSDTSENSHGTGKSLTIKNLLKATKINVDGTNVGINTITPTQQLEVVGTVKATSFMGDGSGLTGVSGSVSDSAYGVGWDGDTTTGASKNALYDKIETLGSASISNAVYGAGWDGDTSTAPSKNAVYDKIETIGSTSGGWTDGGSSIYTTTSTDNVGIGTPNPQFLLDVNGSSRVGGSGNIAFDNSVILNASVDNILGITGGNVGINSTTPESTLDVLGTGRFTSTLRASSLTATGLTSGECVQTTTGGLLTTTGSACGSGGSVTIGTTSPMTGAGSGSSFTLGVDQSKMTLSSIGGTVTDAQVPNSITIDTATTASALATNPTACGSGDFVTDIAADGTLFCDTPSGGGGGVGIGTTNTVAYWNSTSTIGSLNTSTYPSLTELSYVKDVTSAIQTQLNAKDAVTTAGDFITRTANDFDVDALDEDNMASDSAVHLATQQSIKAYVDTAISGVSGGAGGWTDNGTVVYNTTTTDNVGIGTTIPSSSLMIRSATTSGLKIINSAGGASGGAGIQAISDDNAAAVQGDRLGFYTFGGSADTADTINNGAAISGYAEGTYSSSSAPSEIRLETAPAGSTTRSVRMYVKSDGTVGIGTSNPQSTLQVSGDTKVGNGTFSNSSANEDLYVEGNLEVDGTIYGSLSGNASTVTTNANLTGDVTSSGNTATIADSVTVTGWALGASTATTPSGGDNDTSLATTAYVQTELSGLGSGGWTDGGTNIYPTLTSDQVAIGTTTPVGTNALTVRGTIGGSGTGPIVLSDANVGIGTTTAPALLTVGSTGSFQIDTSGNTRVGIGTTTPGTIFCAKSISGGTATIGYCTGSLTNSICGTCN